MTLNNEGKKLTKKQLVKVLHDAGMPSSEIKTIVYPDQKPAVADVSLSRALKDNNVQNWVADEFGRAQHKISLADFIDQYYDELTAVKRVYFKGEFVEEIPDYPTRQKARDSLVKLMQAHTPAVADPNTPPPPPPPTDGAVPVLSAPAQKAMLDAIERGDVKAIERIVFKDGTEQATESKS